MLETIKQTISEFCLNFVAQPYLCYTEHGQHALFYTMLYNKIPDSQRYFTYQNQYVCMIQKEYPTAGKLGKPQRQHWDIAILDSTQESTPTRACSYDYLRLFAVIEFGMNESRAHLEDDIERLCHYEANVEHGFLVHLYRLSDSGNLTSSRDWSSKSPRIMEVEDISRLSVGKPVEIYVARTDSSGIYSPGVWSIKDGVIDDIE